MKMNLGEMMVQSVEENFLQPDLFTTLPYSGHAGWKGTETSKAAARTCNATVIRERVLELYQSGFKGTADECASELGLDPLSVRPRLSELKKHDPPLLRPIGMKPGRFGKQCDVMEACE